MFENIKKIFSLFCAERIAVLFWVNISNWLRKFLTARIKPKSRRLCSCSWSKVLSTQHSRGCACSGISSWCRLPYTIHCPSFKLSVCVYVALTYIALVIFWRSKDSWNDIWFFSAREKFAQAKIWQAGKNFLFRWHFSDILVTFGMVN